MSVVRKRLACVECTRRKIRCDKVVPCRNCTRRGTPCTRADQTPTDSLVERLQARVQQLEATVHELTLQQAPPPRQPQDDKEIPPSQHDNVDPQTEMDDAATILEFLAWGRRKHPAYHDDQASPGDVTTPTRAADDHDEAGRIAPERTAGSDVHLQLLLPRRALLERLVDFHCERVLWYHNAFDADCLQADIDGFYRVAQGQLAHPSVDLQWVALLFAVLCGALACAPRPTAQSWGFPAWEQTTLAQRWFRAVSTCLHEADFTVYHSSYAPQAIATLTMSAHILGFSNSFPVLLASATRIGQSLGLHRLHPRAPQGAWRQLCIQDWFSIPFFESYLIPRPSRADLDADKTKHDVPSRQAYSHFFYKVAAVMPSLVDSMAQTHTLYTRYEQVLEHDRRLRTLATHGLPPFLQNTPLDPDWPCYVPWARRCLAISLSHKVIMIHRKFLAVSFTNPVFIRTRRTCVAAARTIIKEQKEAMKDGGPVLWIQQAFGVTASIILCLDLFHRPLADPEAAYHRQLIHDGLDLLNGAPANMIAKRGVHLLQALLAREPHRSTAPDLPGIVRGVCEQTTTTTSASSSPAASAGGALTSQATTSTTHKNDNFTSVSGNGYGYSGYADSWPPGLDASPKDELETGLGLGFDLGLGSGLGSESRSSSGSGSGSGRASGEGGFGMGLGLGWGEKESLEDILALAANYI